MLPGLLNAYLTGHLACSSGSLPPIDATISPVKSSPEPKASPAGSSNSGDSQDQKSSQERRSPLSDWRPLRSRSFLTDAQVAVLHTQFRRNPFPSKYELSTIAERIAVNKRVVQVGLPLIYGTGVREAPAVPSWSCKL